MVDNLVLVIYFSFLSFPPFPSPFFFLLTGFLCETMSVLKPDSTYVVQADRELRKKKSVPASQVL